MALPLLAYEMHDQVAPMAADLLLALAKHREEGFSSLSSSLLKEVKRTSFAAHGLDTLAAILELKQDPLLAKMCFEVLPPILTIVSSDLKEAQEDEEEDNEDEDEELEEKETILYAISRLCGHLFQHYPQLSMEHLNTALLPFCLNRPLKKQPVQFHHAVVCLVDDMIEHLNISPPSILCSFLLSAAESAMARQDWDTLQAVVYGIGIASAKQAFHDFCLQALPQLITLLQSPGRRPNTNSLIDNIMSAIARIVSSLRSQISDQQLSSILLIWCATLPVTHDLNEVPIVYGWIASEPLFKQFNLSSAIQKSTKVLSPQLLASLQSFL